MPRHHSAVPRLSASPCRARSRVHLAAEMVQQLREAELEAEALRAAAGLVGPNGTPLGGGAAGQHAGSAVLVVPQLATPSAWTQGIRSELS